MIDLTEITDKVARSYWEKLPDRPPYDTLEPQEKVGLKQALMPLIHETATLTEAAVREQISTEASLLEPVIAATITDFWPHRMSQAAAKAIVARFRVLAEGQ